MSFRIGNGYDVHAFTPILDRPGSLVIGGVNIPHNRELVAHSDGDVLVHSLCDALLGALALGDIGQHFPDTDPAYAGVDSLELLRSVKQLLLQKSWDIVNADMTIVAQAPKFGPHIANMRRELGKVLELETDCISIKATTTESLGFTGREEGIACYAVCLIQQISNPV